MTIFIIASHTLREASVRRIGARVLRKLTICRIIPLIRRVARRSPSFFSVCACGKRRRTRSTAHLPNVRFTMPFCRPSVLTERRSPLEIDLARYDREIAVSKQYREHLPITQRVEVFKCSCCPPNINRFFAEIGDAIAFVGDEGVSVEQYIPSRVKTGFGCVEISGDYAVCGKISVSSSDYKSNRIALRIPEWCDDFSAR